MGIFSKKTSTVAEREMDNSTKEILKLETRRKKLEMEIEQIQLELENTRKKFDMDLERVKHKHTLELESKTAVFEREKEIWAKDREDLIKGFEKDKKSFEEDLQKKHDITLQEAVTLTKLEAQQQVKQAEIDKEREITRLEKEFTQQVAEIKSKSAEESYNKFKQVFEELQINGDKNSKHVQELAMKMIDTMAATVNKTHVGVDVNSGTPKLVEGSK